MIIFSYNFLFLNKNYNNNVPLYKVYLYNINIVCKKKVLNMLYNLFY